MFSFQFRFSTLRDTNTCCPGRGWDTCSKQICLSQHDGGTGPYWCSGGFSFKCWYHSILGEYWEIDLLQLFQLLSMWIFAESWCVLYLDDWGRHAKSDCDNWPPLHDAGLDLKWKNFLSIDNAFPHRMNGFYQSCSVGRLLVICYHCLQFSASLTQMIQIH